MTDHYHFKRLGDRIDYFFSKCIVARSGSFDDLYRSQTQLVAALNSESPFKQRFNRSKGFNEEAALILKRSRTSSKDSLKTKRKKKPVKKTIKVQDQSIVKANIQAITDAQNVSAALAVQDKGPGMDSIMGLYFREKPTVIANKTKGRPDIPHQPISPTNVKKQTRIMIDTMALTFASVFPDEEMKEFAASKPGKSINDIINAIFKKSRDVRDSFRREEVAAFVKAAFSTTSWSEEDEAKFSAIWGNLGPVESIDRGTLRQVFQDIAGFRS